MLSQRPSSRKCDIDIGQKEEPGTDDYCSYQESFRASAIFFYCYNLIMDISSYCIRKVASMWLSQGQSCGFLQIALQEEGKDQFRYSQNSTIRVIYLMTLSCAMATYTWATDEPFWGCRVLDDLVYGSPWCYYVLEGILLYLNTTH